MKIENPIPQIRIQRGKGNLKCSGASEDQVKDDEGWGRVKLSIIHKLIVEIAS